MQITVGAKSDVGRVRKKNEDRCGYDEKAGIYVVCDGMGGQAAGEVAAELAVRTILDYYSNPGLSGDLEKDVRGAIEKANSEILQAAEADVRYRKMGSTVVAVAIRENTAAIGNLGDARGYLLRDGVLRQVTKDHSLVAEQVRRGLLKPEEAEKAPWKNVVTKALGGAPTTEADVEVVKLEPNDTVIAATDGVIKFLSDDKLREIVSGASKIEKACELVVNAALDGGSDDNATCMLIRCEKAGATAPNGGKASAATILGG